MARSKPIQCPMDKRECFNDKCTVVVCQQQKDEQIRDAADEALAERKKRKLDEAYEELVGPLEPPKNSN